MPNGFDNPYITGGGENPYTGEITWEGTQFEGWDPIEFQLPGLYQYQGLSPEITSALSNVFGFDSRDGGNFMDLLPGAWQVWDDGEWSESEVLAQIGQEYSYDGDDLSLDWTFGHGDNMLTSGTQDIGAGYFANIFDPDSLASTLSEISGKDIRRGEVKSLTPEMIDKTTSAYYSPYEETQRDTLVDKLSSKMGQVRTGGFAGSGGRQAGLSGAEKLYRGGYEDILGDIMKMRGQSTSDVMDTIYGWQELISED